MKRKYHIVFWFWKPGEKPGIAREVYSAKKITPEELEKIEEWLCKENGYEGAVIQDWKPFDI